MTTKINIIKDPNSNTVSVDFAKGSTLEDFVSYVVNMPDSRGKICLDKIKKSIYYEDGKITDDSMPVFAISSDCYIKDIRGYITTFGYYVETNFLVFLTTKDEDSESEFIEDSKDDLSDTSYRNRAINIIRDTWVYGVYDKYCNLDLTKLSNKGLHALENSLLNLDFVLNQIEKGNYKE